MGQLWAEEEQDRSFTRWRTTRGSYSPTQISGVSFKNGAGQRESISGRQVLASLREAVGT